MYSGELEVQAKRKALAVLQDEINRILNASRVLSTVPKLMVNKDKTGIKTALQEISSIEAEVENLRRKITRDVADVGGLILNRDNILNTAYTMDEIGGYITGISFKLSNIKLTTIKTSHLDKDLTELIELVVDDPRAIRDRHERFPAALGELGLAHREGLVVEDNDRLDRCRVERAQVALVHRLDRVQPGLAPRQFPRRLVGDGVRGTPRQQDYHQAHGEKPPHQQSQKSCESRRDL